MRINVHWITADESDGGNTHFVGQSNRQTRRRRYGSNDRNPGHHRLLRNFKSEPAANHQNSLAYICTLPQRCADHLVHCVMPAKIFANQTQLTMTVEQTRCMDTAGLREVHLPDPQTSG